MDWKRAKTILILAFFMLNIVLAVTLYNNLKGEEISQQTITNTVTILAQNDVKIECPIPKYTGSDYILKYEEKSLESKTLICDVLLGEGYTKADNFVYKNGSKSLVFRGDSGFDFYDSGVNNFLTSSREEDIVKYINTISEELGIPLEEFKQDDYYPDIKAGNETRLVYKGQYKGYTVFDNYIDVESSKNSIKSIKYHYNRPISVTAKEDIEVIPVYKILITEVINYPGIMIKNIDKGFKGYNNDDLGTKTLYESEGLCWRIKTETGEEYYFNARNGVAME